MTRAVALLALFASAPALAAKPTVAILYFDYEKEDDLAVLKKGLTQMLISDLAGHEKVSLVERVRLQDVLAELQLSQSKKTDPETAVKVGKLLGAKYIVVGGYFQVLGQLQVTARLVEVETSKTLAGVQARGKPDDFFQLEQDLSGQLGKAFSEKLETAAAAPSGEKSQPTEAKKVKKPAKLPLQQAVQYAKALDALDKKDKETAKKELQAVVKAQPDFELATLDLATMMK
jgi:TolB-like protein